MHVQLIAGGLGAVIVCLIVASFIASTLRAQRRRALTSCYTRAELHVLVVCDVGEDATVGPTIAHLLDSASCPTRIHVSILESVASIKAPDRLEAALKAASEIGPRFGYYFKDRVQVHRVHQSRNLSGSAALAHLLDSLEGTLDGWVVYMPARAWLTVGWDDRMRDDIASAHAFCQTGITTHHTAPSPHFVVSWPLASSTPTTLETWMYPVPLVANFFTIAQDLTFSTLPMARPSTVLSLGISLRHPFAMRGELATRIFKVGASEDLALTYAAYQFALLVHGASSLGTLDHTRVVSHATQEKALHAAWDADVKFKATFMARNALWIDDGIRACGRASMGMVTTHLPEILIKWGSPGAYETEKESMQYG